MLTEEAKRRDWQQKGDLEESSDLISHRNPHKKVFCPSTQKKIMFKAENSHELHLTFSPTILSHPDKQSETAGEENRTKCALVLRVNSSSQLLITM